VTRTRTRTGFGHSLALENSKARRITLRLEPWGEEIPLAVRERVQITAHSASHAGQLEIELTDQELVVHAWPGATIDVEKEGEVVARCDVPAPELPRLERRGA